MPKKDGSAYTPSYDDKAIQSHPTTPNLSGRSPQDCLTIEEAAQRQVAESPEWLIARQKNPTGDSRLALEKLGFRITSEADDLFYKVTPPNGWTKETLGYWTTIRDSQGRDQITQFFKGAFYDRRAFLNI